MMKTTNAQNTNVIVHNHHVD